MTTLARAFSTLNAPSASASISFIQRGPRPLEPCTPRGRQEPEHSFDLVPGTQLHEIDIDHHLGTRWQQRDEVFTDWTRDAPRRKPAAAGRDAEAQAQREDLQRAPPVT